MSEGKKRVRQQALQTHRRKDRCKRRQATEKYKKRKCAKSHRLGVTPWDLVCVSEMVVDPAKRLCDRRTEGLRQIGKDEQ